MPNVRGNPRHPGRRSPRKPHVMPITKGLPVSAELQLAFLRKISRILDEGKFASIHMLALLLPRTNFP